MTDRFDYTVVLEPQPDGGFTVSVPVLPEVVTEGDTEVEALMMAEEAIRAVLIIVPIMVSRSPRIGSPQFGGSRSRREPTPT
jgi:hypothetical protein